MSTTDPELQEWIELLQSDDLSDRLVAIKNLQHLGDEEALDVVVLAIHDESPAVQKIAIATPREFAKSKVIPKLIPVLCSP